ncbi:DMT family transporter [Glutamicibacter sp. JL.03c]|uniref:DMT family transporter n=1 Tax=Glutamicibacter sp. JL.03c TaxID=2984842 RepID=UPI0021F7CFC5|nr:DMT family transporter [Glutamicibacter sp. JL.03c]UYQ78397.1 DMT family transporter [Glutamicibacter sp. JL.03c]
MAASTISFGAGLAALILLALAVPRVLNTVRQVPSIGVAAFTVCLATGQAIGSMLMDRVGFGGAAPRKINALRILGLLMGFQPAANGEPVAPYGGATTATLVNFCRLPGPGCDFPRPWDPPSRPQPPRAPC